MMPIAVYCCVTYAPSFHGVRTPDEWAALHFVNAVKGTPLGGYAILRLPGGESVLIDQETSGSVANWFAQLAVSAVPWRDLLPCGLVPVPDARCDGEAARPPHTLRLADALTSQLGAGAAAVDVLRWSRPMARAHSADGSRDPQVLYGRLRRRDRSWPLTGRRLVLVDDVVASGAHLRAATAFLRDCGGAVVCALCAARACGTLLPGEHALAPSTHVIADFHSDPDWLLPETVGGIEL
jgi:hypothetical protein